MRSLVLASRNAKKLEELQVLLVPRGYTLHLLSEFSDEEVDETASSFVENALLKARYATRISGLPALADDSGLEVTQLGGAPGVHSARYAGVHGDDAANNQKLLNALSGVGDEQRTARFVCVITLLRSADDPVPIIAQGLWSGRILDAPRGDNGFGYDPLFYVPEYGCSSAELAPAVKNGISHRALAIQALLAQLHP